MQELSTIVDILRQRSETHGSQVIFRYLKTGDIEGGQEEWSYRELFRRSQRVARALSLRGLEGKSALLLYPAGLEYTAAFFGCLQSGTIAVPTFPPNRTHRRSLPRLLSVAGDSKASAVLTTSSLMSMREALESAAPSIASLPWIASDALED